jgi:hypothetical protein
MLILKNKGLGDTIASIAKATGLDKLVGEDCGCTERQEMLNNPDLLINKIFYGTKQNIEVLREEPEGSGEA